MKNWILAVVATSGFITSCAQIENIGYSKLDQPYNITATSNYLPKDVRPQSAYTIYDGSVWSCENKLVTGDAVCCLSSFGTMSPWKYCLMVDPEGNGYGFYELGTNQGLKWSEGKQLLFKK